jgi:FtsH-binding integral membrane protein
MDLRRLRAGEWIAAACGVALLVSLWLPWYSGQEQDSSSLTAWQSLAALDVVLALIAATAVGLLIITASQRVPAVPIALTVFVTFAGLLGVVLVLIRVLSVADGAGGRDWGLWLALASTAGIVAGALVAMRDERPSPAGGHTDVSGRPVPPPPEIETFPAPRP